MHAKNVASGRESNRSAADREVESGTRQGGTLPSGRLTRSKAARRLGVSVTTLRRMEGDLLHPEKGPGGVHLFDVSEVEAAFVKVRSSRQGTFAADGEIAAEVFALLDDGLNPVDVVRRMRVSPEVVEHLQTQWVRMRRAVLLPPEARTRLEDALLGETDTGVDRWALKTAEDVEAALTAAAAPTECARCHENPAFLCRRCAKEYAACRAAQDD
jgi:hypothetical protein